MVAEMKQYLEHPAEMRPANLFDTLDSSLEQANEDDGRKQPYEDNFADEHGVIMEFKESKSNK